MPYTMQSLGYYIEFLSREFNSQIAITYYRRFRCTTYTYEQLYELSLKCASFFLENQLTKGDRILICGENCPEWVVILFGSALTGITLVPIDAKSPREFIQKIRKETSAKWVIVDTFIPVDEGVKQLRLDDLFKVIEACDPTLLEKSNLMVTGDDILEILYTSGTTASPKGAVIRHRNMVASIWSVRQRLIYDESYRFLSMLPLSHVFEQNVGCLSVLRFGGQLVYTKHVRFGQVIELMQQEGITHILVVPAILKNLRAKILSAATIDQLLKVTSHLPLFFKRLLTFPIRKKIGLKLQCFISGGAPLDLNTESFWEDLGILVTQGYGLTEGCAMNCGNTFDHRKKGSVGKPMPKQALCLGDSNEILLGGETIISEYYKAPHLNQEYFQNGWYRTGDVGRFDEEGNLFIVGRLKEMILTSNGLNVFPSDIEEALNAFSGVKESVVFEDPTREGHLLGAIILEAAVDTKAICEEVNKSLLPHQRLAQVFVWFEGSFPKTTSLKIKRHEVLKSYLKGVQKEEICITHDPLLKIIAQIGNVSLKTLSPKTRLSSDLGFDSLDLVELVIQVESHFRKEIDEAKLTGDCTIEDVRHLIEGVTKPKSLPPYKRSWLVKAVGKTLRQLVSLLFRPFIAIRCDSFPKVLTNRPTIFIANHSSHLDTLAVLETLSPYFKKRIMVAAAYDYFFGEKRQVSFLMSVVFPLFPFYRESYFSENLKTIGYLFKMGHHLLIFPEGTRSRDGKRIPFKSGIGMIVKEMEAQVVPIFIEGAYQLWPSHAPYPKPGTIQVRYGEAIPFDSTKTAEEITAILEEVYLEHS